MLYINDQPNPFVGPKALTSHLDAVRQMEYAEVELACHDGLTSLLTNCACGRAFLSYRSDEFPYGYHAVSGGVPAGVAPVEFLRSNGQEDEWALGETVPLLEGLRALKYAFVSGGRAPFLLWHDDAEGAA